VPFLGTSFIPAAGAEFRRHGNTNGNRNLRHYFECWVDAVKRSLLSLHGSARVRSISRRWPSCSHSEQVWPAIGRRLCCGSQSASFAQGPTGDGAFLCQLAGIGDGMQASRSLLGATDETFRTSPTSGAGLKLLGSCTRLRPG